MKTSCMVQSDHHSSDTVEVYHGYAEPAIGCGFHAFSDPHSLYSAHRAQMAGA